jgi:uncharacterized protein (TIGR02996 family)
VTDSEILLRAALADPADDAPRLAYADWLEENDTEVPCPWCRAAEPRPRVCHRCRVPVRDSHEHHSGEDYDGTWSCNRVDACPRCDGTGRERGNRREHAEFIRVQVELARLRGRKDSLGRNVGHLNSHKIGPLMDREQALHTSANLIRWGPDSALWAAGLKLPTCSTPEPMPGHVWMRFERGFVAEVAMPTATFVGGLCGECGGRGTVGTLGGTMGCPRCATSHDTRGHGRAVGVAAALFGCQPVTAVRLVDREPHHDDRERWPYHFHRFAPEDYHPYDQSIPADEVPGEIWDLMAGENLRGTLAWTGWSSRDAALAALSDACVRYGRQLAGLGVTIRAESA